MCGIAGIWGEADEETVRAMMERIAHRGPDAEGLFAGRQACGTLGHRRLSIMDPAGGDQPLFNEDRSLAIVANGEVYNFPRLRERLADSHRFQTGNDSEAALHLYEEVGEAAAARLHGMFAFAIADGRDLYLARDAIGIKPLYVGKREGSLVFGSELKAMAGFASEVEEFPPGTWFHSRIGFRRFYAVPDRAPRPMPREMRLRILRETLETAVERRLMSDVPVGAFLSGGLDSSIIAALMRRRVSELHTFSVGIEGCRDLEAARVVARHLDTTHHEYVFTVEEALDRLPEIIYHLESFDQDLVRSAIPCFFVSRLASQYVKVILTGEGADELFAGYNYYKGYDDPALLHRELRRSVCALHNVNLQRVDRLTMAHSIEGRVPFLDVDMIDVAQTIPPELKLRTDNRGRTVEKWILRKACEDLLPHKIVWREKEQFDEGSGTAATIAAAALERMSHREAGEYLETNRTAGLRSPEECLYHRLLAESYEDPLPVLHNVARWAERPEPRQHRAV